MSLQYKVLWIDDNIKDFKRQAEALVKYIDSLFFLPEVDLCKDVDSAKRYVESKKYDVIFSDYNIEEEKGSDFIKTIREKNVNTEVLFYSGQSQLPDNKLDRVSYFFSSGTHWEERLLRKMQELITLTVEKLNDLTQLRGLVMAEVSDLDERMKEIIELYCNQDLENQKSLHSYIIKNLESRVKDSLLSPKFEDEDNEKCKKICSHITENKCGKHCTHIWKDNTVKDYISEQAFDSYSKARAINFIFKRKSKPQNFLERYYNEIIKIRNNLAHCSSVYKNGDEILCTKNGDVSFNKQDFDQIRRNILKYRKMFDEILNELQETEV